LVPPPRPRRRDGGIRKPRSDTVKTILRDLHLLDSHPLLEGGRDRVVHVLREGASASGSFMTARPPTILSGRFVGMRGRPGERIVADGH
jgi:hypothetical protein